MQSFTVTEIVTVAFTNSPTVTRMLKDANNTISKGIDPELMKDGFIRQHISEVATSRDQTSAVNRSLYAILWASCASRTRATKKKKNKEESQKRKNRRREENYWRRPT
jgi:phage I-like protein